MPNFDVKNPGAIKSYLKRSPFTKREVAGLVRRAPAIKRFAGRLNTQPEAVASELLDPKRNGEAKRALDELEAAIALVNDGTRTEAVSDLLKRQKAGEPVSIPMTPGISKAAEMESLDRVRAFYSAARHHQRRQRSIEILFLVGARAKIDSREMRHEREQHGNSPEAIAKWVNAQIRFSMPEETVSPHQVKRMLSKLAHAGNGANQ